MAVIVGLLCNGCATIPEHPSTSIGKCAQDMRIFDVRLADKVVDATSYEEVEGILGLPTNNFGSGIVHNQWVFDNGEVYEINSLSLSEIAQQGKKQPVGIMFPCWRVKRQKANADTGRCVVATVEITSEKRPNMSYEIDVWPVGHPNAFLSVDNTFASPYNQRPIELGADFTVESLTKYINGHGDAMGGAIIGKKEYLDIVRAQSQVNLGATISPFNAWLIMRGSVTLPLRMKQHNENALKVARWLEKQECVSFVAYPGLESNKGYKTAKKQMLNGYGGVLSFGLKADHDTHNRFVQNLRVITSAVSLGHDESLIVFIGENDERQYLYPEEFRNGFFRFSVGIEDADDIINDLKNAMQKVFKE